MRSTSSTTPLTARRTFSGRWCTWAARPREPTLLSANLDSGGTESSDGSTVTYTLGDTLSPDSGIFPGGGLPCPGRRGERTLQAMAATFAAYTQDLDRLSFRCQGEELTVTEKPPRISWTAS